jgi:type II secretory pathway component GspD/PulD (secretin)
MLSFIRITGAAAIVACAPISGITAPASSVSNRIETGGGVSDQTHPHFVARDQLADVVFRALGTEIGKPIQMSRKSRRARITGNFALDRPFDVVEKITSSLGLVWYFDGHAIFIYDGSEVVSTVISLSSETVTKLIAFLKENSLYDKRYPIRKGSQGLVYLSGPPKYIEIVRSSVELITPAAAQGMPSQGTGGSGRQVDVVKLRYISVDDRRYEQRGNERMIPGLASVLRDVWKDRADVRVAPSAPTTRPGETPERAPGTSADSDSTERLLPLLPPGVKELPPFRNEEANAGYVPLRDSLLRVVAYPSNNSLLLSGTTAQISAAKQLIAKLDVAKRQVELSLWVIDISQTNLDALGAQWSAEGNLGALGVRFNSSGRKMGSTLNREETASFIASISALSEKNKAHIVSRPMLLAQDNSPAIFDSSRSFYVKLEGERSVALESVTYGTMINVIPRILAPTGPIEMELEIEDGSSSNPDEMSGLKLPDVARTQIRTMARVLGDQSLLVGGYTHDENRTRNNKIPLLGDIPLIGGLFRYHSTSDANSVRIFLIQPRVLPDGETFDAATVDRPKPIDNAVDALKNQLKSRHV